MPEPVEKLKKPFNIFGQSRPQWTTQATTALSRMHRTIGIVWDTHKVYTMINAAINILLGFMPSAVAWVSKLLIDAVTVAISVHGTGTTTTLVIALVILQSAIFATGSLLHSIADINLLALQELTAERVQLIILRHANKLDLAFFESPSFYDSLQQAQADAIYRPMETVEQMLGLVRDMITFFSILVLTFSISWVVALASLCVPIPRFIASYHFGRQGYMNSNRQSPSRRMMSYLFSLLTRDTYSKEIKLFGLGDFFLKWWGEISLRVFQENRSLVRRRSWMNLIWGSLSLSISSGTYIYAGLLAIAGHITLGDLTFFAQAVGSVQGSFGSLLNGLSNMYENSLYLTNLYQFLDYKPLVQNVPSAHKLELPIREGIEFRNVSFTYPGKTEPVLRNLSFRIHPNETVAFVGSNGAGKTTIAKLIARLYDPCEGAILIDAVDIRKYDLQSLHDAIGVIFQDYVTYFSTVTDNIGVGHVAEINNLDAVKSAAKESGASHFISKLPKGFDTMLGSWFDEGHQLSGGEWQRVALARAFMRNAPILVLDEPTASADARSEYELFARMKDITSGKIAIFISHRFSTVRLVNRIFVLEKGAIKETGSHDELLALNGTYAELFNLQASAYS